MVNYRAGHPGRLWRVIDWNTASALTTGGGTLVLAVATYASVRSANRAARAAERSLLAELRPLLVQSSAQDPPQRVGFAGGTAMTVAGGEAAIELIDGRIYVVISLRNVGSGIAVVHGGYVRTEVVGARPD